VGPRANLDGCGEENILPPSGVENRTVQPVTTLVSVWLDLWCLLPESPRQVNCLNNDLNYLLACNCFTVLHVCRSRCRRCPFAFDPASPLNIVLLHS